MVHTDPYRGVVIGRSSKQWQTPGDVVDLARECRSDRTAGQRASRDLRAPGVLDPLGGEASGLGIRTHRQKCVPVRNTKHNLGLAIVEPGGCALRA